MYICIFFFIYLSTSSYYKKKKGVVSLNCVYANGCNFFEKPLLFHLFIYLLIYLFVCLMFCLFVYLFIQYSGMSRNINGRLLLDSTKVFR